MFDVLFAKLPADRHQRRAWGLFATVHLAILAIMLILLFAAPARAQEVPLPSATTFDFGPWAMAILDFVAPTLIGVVGLLGVWILKRLAAWLGLKIDDSQRAAVEQALLHAVNFALEKVGDRAKGGIPIDLKHDAIVTAAAYAQRSIPGALKHFNIDDRRLAEMVESRLEGVLVEDGSRTVSEPVTAASITREPIRA